MITIIGAGKVGSQAAFAKSVAMVKETIKKMKNIE